MASGRGERGRESVGDGVPTAKLLLLLLRALRKIKKKKREREKQKQMRDTVASVVANINTHHTHTCVISAQRPEINTLDL